MAVLDIANNYTIEVKFCTYNYVVVSVIINLDANHFYLFIICLFFIIYNI